MAVHIPSVTPAVGIEIEGLRKSFGTQSVLQGIDLQIRDGEFVALVGKSGCGKSTLLRLLAGLETPTTGSIAVNNAPLEGLNRNARVMFQESRLLPWKRVVNNVGLGLKGNWKPTAERALAEVGLLDRAGEWPGVISGGQRQRVALARALVHQPQLLLLDEPLGALDALTRIAMQRLIENVWQEHGFSILLITHDVEEAVALADRVLLIEDGQVALDLAVNLPRPRARGAAEFIALKERILERILGNTEGTVAPVQDPAPAQTADDGAYKPQQVLRKSSLTRHKSARMAAIEGLE